MLGEFSGMLGCDAQHGAVVLGDVYGAIREREKLSNRAGCASGPSHLGCVWCLHTQGWLCAHISPAQTHTHRAHCEITCQVLVVHFVWLPKPGNGARTQCRSDGFSFSLRSNFF